MKGFGWSLFGYLLAVAFAAFALVVVVELFGTEERLDLVQTVAFFGKILGGGLVVFGPVYFLVRLGLAVFRKRSALAFVVAFSSVCIVFGSAVQVPDIWLVGWDAEIEVVSDTVANLILHQRLGGGFELGPLVFTQVTLGFWLIVGAAFGLIIWGSERMQRGGHRAGSRTDRAEGL